MHIFFVYTLSFPRGFVVAHLIFSSQKKICEVDKAEWSLSELHNQEGTWTQVFQAPVQ